MKKLYSFILLIFTAIGSTFSMNQQSQPSREAVYTYGKTTIRLIEGDMFAIPATSKDPIALVNAANSRLQHGGGIAFAFARQFPDLQRTSNEYLDNYYKSGIEVGNAVAVGGNYAQYVIHAVGPDCRIKDQSANKASLLANAYTQSLSCVDYALNSRKGVGAIFSPVTRIAFPAISTAIFGYDVNDATPIAITAIKTWLDNNPTTSLKEIILVVRAQDKNKSDKAYFNIYLENIKQHLNIGATKITHTSSTLLSQSATPTKIFDKPQISWWQWVKNRPLYQKICGGVVLAGTALYLIDKVLADKPQNV